MLVTCDEWIFFNGEMLCDCHGFCHVKTHRIAETNKWVVQMNEKQGYLKKESLHLKIFKKRWIVLKDNKLYSFKYKYDYNATEILDLSIYNMVKKLSKTHFQISSNSESRNKKPRLFAAISTNVANEWIKCIRNCTSL